MTPRDVASLTGTQAKGSGGRPRAIPTIRPVAWARIAVASGAALAALAAGCGKSEPDDTPMACLAGPDAYLESLSAAPGEVRLDGETPISECLPADQEAGDLAEAGSAMVAAATSLNQEARADQAGPAPVQLGYLIGAAERGAEGTAGIHTDLVRRLNSAASFDPGGRPSEAFEQGFERGYEAGQETG
jgi:hypothetical protein